MCYTVGMTSEDSLPVEPSTNAVREVLPEPPDPELADQTGEQALMSRIPKMSGGERIATQKADYLGFRATGFPVRQACYLAGISQATLNRYRSSDPVFVDVETNRLEQLQAQVGNDVVHLEFLRNMRMALRTDSKILYKAVHNLDTLSDREFQYLKRVRGLYSSQDLMNITRALVPESATPIDFAELVLRITRETAEVRIGKVSNPEHPTPHSDILEGESRPA